MCAFVRVHVRCAHLHNRTEMHVSDPPDVRQPKTLSVQHPHTHTQIPYTNDANDVLPSARKSKQKCSAQAATRLAPFSQHIYQTHTDWEAPAEPQCTFSNGVFFSFAVVVVDCRRRCDRTPAMTHDENMLPCEMDGKRWLAQPKSKGYPYFK